MSHLWSSPKQVTQNSSEWGAGSPRRSLESAAHPHGAESTRKLRPSGRLPAEVFQISEEPGLCRMAWKHFEVPVDELKGVTRANKVWPPPLRPLRLQIKWQMKKKAQNMECNNMSDGSEDSPSGRRLQRTHSCLNIKAGQRAGRWSRGPTGRESRWKGGTHGPGSQLSPLVRVNLGH